MATDPQFATTPARVVVQVTTANTARDGSGTPVTILTAGSSGTRVTSVDVVATGTTTAGVVRLFVHDGSNARLLDEILVPAISPSATVKVFRARLDYPAPFVIPSGSSLRATTNNTETFNIHVEAASL